MAALRLPSLLGEHTDPLLEYGVTGADGFTIAKLAYHANRKGHHHWWLFFF